MFVLCDVHVLEDKKPNACYYQSIVLYFTFAKISGEKY